MKGSTSVAAGRVMPVPLTPTAKAVLFRPQKTATVFDAVIISSTEARRTLAKAKLKAAAGALVSALVKV